MEKCSNCEHNMKCSCWKKIKELELENQRLEKQVKIYKELNDSTKKTLANMQKALDLLKGEKNEL